MKKILLLSLISVNCYADQINISAIGQNVIGCRVDHRCELRGKHDIQIVNDTNEDHDYKYSYTLCALKEGYRTDCHYAKNNIKVKAHTTWNNHFDSYSQPIFSIPSGYAYIVNTSLFGYESNKSENKYSVKVRN